MGLCVQILQPLVLLLSIFLCVIFVTINCKFYIKSLLEKWRLYCSWKCNTTFSCNFCIQKQDIQNLTHLTWLYIFMILLQWLRYQFWLKVPKTYQDQRVTKVSNVFLNLSDVFDNKKSSSISGGSNGAWAPLVFTKCYQKNDSSLRKYWKPLLLCGLEKVWAQLN